MGQFSGDPVEDDARQQYSNKFKVNMLEAPSNEPMWFLYGCVCMPCSQYQLRVMSLGEDWPKNYSCCQGYLSCCGKSPAGNCGEQSMPEVCLCCEVWCCAGCAVSATRMHVLDKYNIVPDPMDNKIMRFNNCIQLLTCVVTLLSIFIDGLDQAADIMQLIAKLVFHLTVGCMTAQVYYELQKGGAPGSGIREGEGGTGQQTSSAPRAQEGMDK